MNNISYISSGLFLGSLNGANNYESLKKNGITHILGLIDYQLKYPDFIYKVHSNLGDMPSENILQYFKEDIEFIDNCIKNGGKVFVHCHAGISRSSTIVIAYIMYKYNISFKQSYLFVKEGRNIIHPNVGFVCQLVLFEEYKEQIMK